MFRIGLIGCGAIGGSLANAICNGKAGECLLKVICDIDVDKMEQLKEELETPDLIVTPHIEDLLKRDIDLVIEAANQYVIKNYAEAIIDSGKNLMSMSVGAFRDNDLFLRVKHLAKINDKKVYLPSGAICGLDGVKAASLESIKSIEITSTKNPKSLEGAPFLRENNIDISNIKGTLTVFEGSANRAAEGFPRNINVAVALSLAGIGVEKTKVRIIVEPEAHRTMHEIRVVGDFGDLYTRVRNLLHPENPKTSYLAVLSAIRTLRKITEPIQIGT